MIIKKVLIKKLSENASTPAYSSPNAAGADLRACCEKEIEILPGETVMVPTGLAMELPEGCAGLIYARSGLASKKGLAPANKVGVVDSDYRGEILVAIYNHGKDVQTILPGERIAQMVLTPVWQGEFEETEELCDTQRGQGGFGSTGRV